MFDETLKTATGTLAKRLDDVDRALDKVSVMASKRVAERRGGEPDDLFSQALKYRPDQARDDHGRFADEGKGGGEGGSSETRAMAARTGARTGGGKKPKKMSLKEITSKFRAAKNKRTQVRSQIKSLQSRIKDMKRGSTSHKKATARLQQLKENGANLTREMGRLADMAAKRRGPVRQQDWLMSTMAGLPVFRDGPRRKLASDTSTDGDDLFVLKGYPEYDDDQLRGPDGKWTAGGGGGSSRGGGKKPKSKPATTAGKPKAPAKKPKKPKAAPAAKPKAPPKKKPAAPKKPKTVKPKSEVKQPRKPRAPKRPAAAPAAAAEAPPQVQAQPELSGLAARDRARLDTHYSQYDSTTAQIDKVEADIAAAQSRLEHLQDRLSAAPEGSYAELSYERDIEDVDSKLGGLRTTRSRLHRERDTLRTTITELEARLRGQKRFVGKQFSKRLPPPTVRYQLLKADDNLGLIFGWAIVSSENGEPYYDTQGDHIPEDAMLSAAADFMLSNRSMKVMHEGKKAGSVVFAWPMTEEIARAMGISGERTGLMIAVKPDNPNVLARFRDKQYTGFSIGGTRLIDEEVADD
jgi:hypothetical protein